MQETKEYTEQDRLDFIEALGIEYTATFVPFSRSRNKDSEHKSLNWIVTLKKNNQELSTDYMQGIGHLPGYKQLFGSVSMDEANEQRQRIEAGTEQGKYIRKFYNMVGPVKKDLEPPSLMDVLCSLSLDSDVLDSPCYEDWAANFGYEEDSRKGEKIYRDCLAIALKMRAMFGDDGLTKLREAYQDY